MKTLRSLSELYEHIIIKEAEKQPLSNPSNDEVGKLPDDLFSEKPKMATTDSGPNGVKNIDKPVAGPSHKITNGSTSKPTMPKSGSSKGGGFKGSAPAKDVEPEEHEEMEGEDVVPKNEEESKEHKNKEKKTPTKESFTMSAFENLFKKTLLGEAGEGEPETENTEETEDIEDMSGDASDDSEEIMDEAPDAEPEQEDLLSDIQNLKKQLEDIISKLTAGAESSDDEMSDDDSYTEDDFDNEFNPEGEEEDEDEVKTEALHTPKTLSPSKGKGLTSKSNQVGGKLKKGKGGKAHSGKFRNEPDLKPAPKNTNGLQKSGHVKSSLNKGGEFFK